MKIAVLGTGNVGGALGLSWARSGHDVMFGSRDPSSERVAELTEDDQARAGSYAEAVAHGEVVLLALPWPAVREIVEAIDNWDAKIVIDCTNPLNRDFTGLEFGFTTSAAEQIAEWCPGARVVKAFNSASAATMADPNYDGAAATMIYCGDDAAAKEVIGQLCRDLGFEPADGGPLNNARYLEPLAMLYIHLAVREGWGSHCAFKIMSRAKPSAN